MTAKPFPTDDTITVPIPADLAERFIREGAYRPVSQRGFSLLQFGTVDLGYWRIETIASQYGGDGYPRMVATLRQVLLP